MKTKFATAATLLAVALSVSACDRTDRWCERDATDEVVDNSYCDQGMAGYEWEPDHDKPKSKKKPKMKTSRH